MIAIYSGTSPARVYEPEPPREQTRQFPAPVLTPERSPRDTRVEFQTRLYLASKYSGRNEVAKARVKTVLRIFTEGSVGSPALRLLTAFDAQNRAVLGLEGL